MSAVAPTKRLRSPSLEETFERLRVLKRADSLDSEGRAALAECAFRLALHPGRSLSEAVGFLIEGVRNDGSNPKYAYHLSRLFFLHDMIPEAERWLVQACRLCPTSHRLWSHVYLLQAENFARVYKNLEKRDQFDLDAAAKRRNAIAASVRQAENRFPGEWLDFVLPESRARKEQREKKAKAGGRKVGSARADAAEPERQDATPRVPSLPNVRRLRDADRCRWSGIHDLEFEVNLRADDKPKNVAVSARQNAVAPLAEQLQIIADSSPRRAGGPAGFAVAAVQWLLAGYPVESVRRIATRFSDEERASLVSLKTLDLVCTIYEAPPAEAPARLAAAMESGALPPTVVALILRRYALWRALEFEWYRTYFSARRFLAEARQRLQRGEESKELREEIVGWTKKVEQAAKKTKGDPPKVLKDAFRPTAKTDRLTPENAVATLGAFEDCSKRLVRVREELARILRDRIVTHAEAGQESSLRHQAAADLVVAAKAVDRLREIAQKKIAQIAKLNQAISHLRGELPEDFAARCENCDRECKEATVIGPLRKNLEKSGKKLSDVTFAGEASADVQHAHAELAEVAAAKESPASADPSVSATSLESMEALVLTLAQTKEAAFAFVRDDLELRAANESNPAALADARADLDATEALVKSIKAATTQGIEDLKTLRERLTVVSSVGLPDGFGSRMETCDNRMRDVASPGSLKRRLDKLGRKLTGVAPGSLHPTIARLQAQLDAGAQAELPAPSPAVAGGDALAELEASLADAVGRLERDFARLGMLVEAHGAGLLSSADAAEAEEIRRGFDDVMAKREQILETAKQIREAGDISRDRLESLEKVQLGAVSLLQRRRPFQKRFDRLPQPTIYAADASTHAPATATGVVSTEKSLTTSPPRRSPEAELSSR